MNQFSGTTQTRLLASIEGAKTLIGALEAAVAKSVETGKITYANVVLEQMEFDGPWGLVIAVGAVNGRDKDSAP